MDNTCISEHLKEECGVIGLYSDKAIDPSEAYFALHALQHRGQESAGLAAANGHGITYHKNTGLLSEVFSGNQLNQFKKHNIFIGHVRDSGSGANTMVNAQPLVAEYKNGQIAVAHNGSIVNTKAITRCLQNDGAVFQTHTGSEIFIHLLARYAHLGLAEAVLTMMKDLHGSYCLIVMTPNALIGVRDPFGYRPLVLGKKDSMYVLASESVALDAIGAELVRDVMPGEAIIINKNGITSLTNNVATPRPAGLCLFEYVYLARPDSIIDGISVSNSRIRAGRALAKVAPVEADMVAGVPNSALAAAIGYSQGSGIPYGDALVMNRYVGRTFIQADQNTRELSVKMKLNPLAANIEGKRIVLVDDSIVRGTTSKNLVELLKSAGAKEVHMRISSPPVRHPCYFGINTPTKKQLISASLSIENIRKKVNADSLEYLPIDQLVQAVSDGSSVGFCTGCFNGNYPENVAKCRRLGCSRI